jgi:hypothetical protein
VQKSREKIKKPLKIPLVFSTFEQLFFSHPEKKIIVEEFAEFF